MAKGQMRPSREKKKPKSDNKEKPKQLSAYKQAQMQGASTTAFSTTPGKKT